MTVDEIYIDYGSNFDRKDYTFPMNEEEEPGNAAAESNRRKAQLLREKEDMMMIQPVTSERETAVDQDTSMSEGFLSKLTKQEAEKDKYRNTGIISPEEGSKLFTEVGANMFGNAEDLELIESLTGKKSSSRPIGQRAASTPSAAVDDFGMNDADFLQSMLGKTSEDLKIPVDAGAIRPVVDVTAKKTVLTVEEAAELQSRLDNLTDEQVERVFEKMRQSLGDKMRNELRTAIETKRAEGDTQGKGSSMPRTKPLDPAVRAKYDAEFSEVEEELERMYNDPLGVWQDLIKSQQQPQPPSQR